MATLVKERRAKRIASARLRRLSEANTDKCDDLPDGVMVFHSREAVAAHMRSIIDGVKNGD